MARKRKHKTNTAAILQDPDGLAGMAEQFFEWMAVTNYAETTIKNRRVYLGYFITWCEDRGLRRPTEITKPIIERYQRYLFHYRKKRDAKPLSVRSQHARLVPLRAYFKWLARNNHILYNPAGEIDMPRLETRLPRNVLTTSEAEMIINLPDIDEPLGMRDRAILEVLYSTGMRRMELIGLSIYNIDIERGTVMVYGKGKKDRMIPIGERAIKWTQKYLYEVRPSLAVTPDRGTLFLTEQGEPFTPNRLTQMVRNYVNASDCVKKGSCHMFRHTMATLMLENGADIRYIQHMLGHAELTTTQIYTQVSIRKLKEIHTLTHPSARLRRRSPEPAFIPNIGLDELEKELIDEMAEDAELED